MPRRMVQPGIKEVSGVDHPAHLREGWLVQKSISPNVATVLARAEAMAKGSAPTTTDLDKGNDHMPAIDKATLAPEVATYIETLEKAVAGSSSATDEPTEAELFEKALADLPEPVRKHMLTQQREAAEAKAMAKSLVDERETSRFEAIAKTLLHLPGVGEGFAKSLQSAATAAGEETFKPVLDVLKAADAALAESGLFGEIGSGALLSGADTAEAELMAKAVDLQKAEPTLSHAEAVEKAASANPDLVIRQRREALAANRMEG